MSSWETAGQLIPAYQKAFDAKQAFFTEAYVKWRAEQDHKYGLGAYPDEVWTRLEQAEQDEANILRSESI